MNYTMTGALDLNLTDVINHAISASSLCYFLLFIERWPRSLFYRE